jgi:hypothetical protein
MTQNRKKNILIKPMSIIVSMPLLILFALCPPIQAKEYDLAPRRLTVESPVFYVSENDIDLQASYSGFDPNTQKRFSRLTINRKVMEMINDSNRVILASIFLFDIIYSDQQPQIDIVNEITNAIIEKKKSDPSITVVFVLDPINRAYGHRIGPAVKRLLENGVDIFYSDLVPTKSATTLGIGELSRDALRFVDNLSFGSIGRALSVVTRQKLPLPNPLDEGGTSIESLWNVLALKANHRKLLVTDNQEIYEALISSANPHNASIPSANYSVSVKGELAKYIYMVIRQDVIQSKKMHMVDWSNKSKDYKEKFLTDVLPAIAPSGFQVPGPSSSRPVGVSFVTESRIRDKVIEMLEGVKADDHVRIQMFYLSEFKVIDAIVNAAKRLKNPMRIILDPNKDAFGKVKDGTPNRQVAAYLMKKKKELGLNLDIRWYDTHGEQNHAKIMSITSADEQAPKYELINGSANWTGKNLKDINLEANVYVRNSKKIIDKFNKLFDMLWGNSDGMIYTIDYKGKYEAHTGMNKWRDGEKWGYVSW